MLGTKRRMVRGLKKLGDFTMSKGHGYPLVLYNESKHNILALVGKANKSLLLLLSSNLLHLHYYK
jgi:hypothetical protein